MTPVGSSTSTPSTDLNPSGSRADQSARGAAPDGWLFIGGCVANQGAVYDRFDAVVLLSAPVDVLLRRVADRPNPFGSTAQQRATIADDHAAYEPLLRAGASHEIAATTPLATVVATLEEIAEAVSGA
jgi:hypothetical protein